MMPILIKIYWVIMVLTAICAVVRYRRLDRTTQVFCWITWVGLLTEIAGYYTAVRYRSNYPVYNMYFFVNAFLLLLYFYRSEPGLRKYGLMWIIGSCLALFAVVNAIVFQPLLTSLNVNFLLVQSFLVFSLAFFSFWRLLFWHKSTLNIWRCRQFWCAMMIAFNECAVLTLWGAYPIFGWEPEEHSRILDVLILSKGTLVYLFFLLLFCLDTRLHNKEEHYA